MKFEINPPYSPVTEMPYSCVPAVLQMILKRRGLKYQSQEEIGYQLGLIVPSDYRHHFTRVRTGSEPKAGYGTRTSKKEFSVPNYFRKNNLPLKLTQRQPAHIQELRECLNNALTCGDDVIICYNRRLLFGDGDLEHVSLIQSFDNEADTVLIIDPAIGAPKHRKLNLEQLSRVLISDRAGKQTGLWIIRSSRVKRDN
jgi:hypothetical protein